LGVKILKFFDADPGSGIETVRIRDVKKSDPGSGINIDLFLSAKQIFHLGFRIDFSPTKEKYVLILASLDLKSVSNAIKI
jgi:hypothetical protein